MPNRSTLTVAGEVVGIYPYALCELDFYMFDEGDRLCEADDEVDAPAGDWDDEDLPDAGEVGFVTGVLAARSNLENRGVTQERLVQLETVLSRQGLLEPYFWHGELRAYAPWTGLGEWFACQHGQWAKASFPGEHLDLDRFSQDVAAVSGLDASDIQRGNRLFYYRFLLERADRREEVRLDTQDVLAASGEARSAFEAEPLEADMAAYIRAVHGWVETRPPASDALEKRVPGAPLVKRLLTKLGEDGLPQELKRLIQADPDPKVRALVG